MADEEVFSEKSEKNYADLEDNSESLSESSDWELNFSKEKPVNLLNSSFEDKGDYVFHGDGIQFLELD